MRIPKQSKILSNAGNGFGAIQRAYTKTGAKIVMVQSSTKAHIPKR